MFGFSNNKFNTFIKTLDASSSLYKFICLLLKGIEARVIHGPYDCVQIVYLSLDDMLHISDGKKAPKNFIELNKIHCIIRLDNNTIVSLFNISSNEIYANVHFIKEESASIFTKNYNILVEEYNLYLDTTISNKKCKYNLLL
jgi:hypothetical protein